MNRPKEIKIHSSVWVNKSYSGLNGGGFGLATPNPAQRVPENWRRFPGAVQNGQRAAGSNFGATRKPHPPKMEGPRSAQSAVGPRHTSPTAMTRRLGQLPTNRTQSPRGPRPSPSAMANEPFFASNLKYYPHLPQPLWVGQYQTYAEIKEAMSSGNHSQIRAPMPPESHLLHRRPSSPAPQVPDEPPSPAPCRRYSMTRRGPVRTGSTLANILLSAGSHLLRQPFPEIQRQMQVQMQQPVQDPLFTQFLARQEGLRASLLDAEVVAHGSSEPDFQRPSTSKAAQKLAKNSKPKLSFSSSAEASTSKMYGD